VLPTMTATKERTAADKNACGTTAAQTAYNARDRLADRLDDATVRQAVEGDL